MKRSQNWTENTPSKKQKDHKREDYNLNCNKVLDKQYEVYSFNKAIQLPPSALQGLTEKADYILK